MCATELTQGGQADKMVCRVGQGAAGHGTHYPDETIVFVWKKAGWTMDNLASYLGVEVSAAYRADTG